MAHKKNNLTFIISTTLLLLFSSCTKDTPNNSTATKPSILTTNITNIGQQTAQSGGNITSDGGASITSRGVCWTNNTSSPTILDSKTNDGSGIGVFSSSLTNLQAGTKYYLRAYATNSVGTAYGSLITFYTSINLDSLKNGLVCYLPFSGNSGDSSGKNNHGVVNGASLTMDRFGNPNKAYLFDGLTNNIRVPNSSTLSASTYQFSLSAWVKLNQYTGGQNKGAYIIDKDIWGINYQDFDANPSVEKIRFGGYTSSAVSGLYTTTVPPLNQWVHIVYTYDAKSYANYYINGVIESSIGISSGISILPTSSDMYIGKSVSAGGNFYGGFGSNFNYFNGAIDDIRVYNRVLTEAEVSYLATH